MNQDWRDELLKARMGGGRIVILGVGNSQRGDDAAGGLVVRKLRKLIGKRPEQRMLILDGGETPESLTGEIRKFGPSLVLIVDAAASGHKPGTIYVVDRDKIGHDDLTTHRIPLTLLIKYLEDSVGCRVEIIGIEPENLGLSDPVSGKVSASISLLARELAKILNS